MFKFKKKFEINSHDVIDFLRLLGRFGLKFEFSDEYWTIDELDPDRKKRWRRFVVEGTRKQLKELYLARDIIAKYLAH
jgi:hypothetical protein